MTEKNWIKQALSCAREAEFFGDVPVGAVLVHKGHVLAHASNQVEYGSDPTAHAEILVLREGAKKLNTPRLTDCDLYVTLEPCTLCAAAISFARIRRLYFGAYDPKGGAVEHGIRWFSQATCHHRPEVYGGLHEQECAALLKTFFQSKRGKQPSS